jgi:hypothetical protein
MSRSRCVRVEGGYARSVLGRRGFVAAPAVVALVALLLPWYTSGTTVRSAFSLARALNDSGAVEARWAQLALESCDAFPVLIAVCLAAFLLRFARTAVLFAVLSGVATAAASLAAITELGTGIGIGPWVGLIASPIAVAGSIVATVR